MPKSSPNPSPNYDELSELLTPFLSPERIARIDTVLSNRSRSVVTVFENTYDRGNINAVYRSAESLGFDQIHHIERPGHRQSHRALHRTSKGSDKWLDFHYWESPRACFEDLRDQGYRIAATTLTNAQPIATLDFGQPWALVFGSEGFGVSPELLAELGPKDARIQIPMAGFTESL